MGGTNKNSKAPKNTTRKNKKSTIKLLSNADLEKKHLKMFGYSEPTMNKRNKNMNKNMKMR
jgi:hypothetical protein